MENTTIMTVETAIAQCMSACGFKIDKYLGVANSSRFIGGNIREVAEYICNLAMEKGCSPIPISAQKGLAPFGLSHAVNLEFTGMDPVLVY